MYEFCIRNRDCDSEIIIYVNTVEEAAEVMLFLNKYSSDLSFEIIKMGD